MEEFMALESDGLTLRGVLHLPAGRGLPGVVMCHGFTGNRSESHFLFTKTARHLVRHGFAVLRFDFRGSGDSDGRFSDMTIGGEIADAGRALDWISARPEIDKDRLGLIGLSLGGCVAACLSGRRTEVRATVLWSAVARTSLLIERLLGVPERRAELRRHGRVDIGGLAVSQAFFDDARTIEPLRELKESRADWLIVHGKNDQSVPFSHAHDYLEACEQEGRSVQLLAVEGADHTYSSLLWESSVIEQTREFLAASLGVGDRNAETAVES